MLEQESLREVVGSPRGWAGCEARWEETCALDEAIMYDMNIILQTPCEESPDEEFLDMAQRTFLNCLGKKNQLPSDEVESSAFLFHICHDA